MDLPHRAFRERRNAAALNILAVGASLAACTGSAFRLFWADTATYAALSTVVIGTLWAAAIRMRSGKRGIPVGWLLSPIFACVNAMLCMALLTTGKPAPDPAGAAILIVLGGGLIGAIIWIPACVLTLLLFGLPVAHAQRIAARGLAGADRGEIIVGIVSSVLALVPLVGSPPSIETVLALVAIACGLGAATLASLRERARRAFVRRVAAGEVAHFRVEPSAEGKVLVRVTTTGMAYRVSDFVEEIARLGEGDEVINASSSPSTRTRSASSTRRVGRRAPSPS
jgi:hypothetical protein